MTWWAVEVIEWTCDKCGRSALTADQAPDGWTYDQVPGYADWCERCSK